MAVADTAIAIPADLSRRRTDWKNVWNWFVFIVIAAVVLVPLILLILGSFSIAKMPNEFSLDKMSLGNYIEVWTDPSTYGLFYNTFVYVAIATVTGIGIACTIAWLVEEAAGVSGASPWRVMLKVFFPLLMPAIIGLWIWVVLLSIRIAGVPLLLAEGPNNQVVATLIWTMWDEGAIEPVGAIGTLMIVGIFGLVFLLRAVGFGGRMIQTR